MRGARLTDALKANFPKLHLALGDEAFAGAAAGYIAAHPSLTRSIRWYGQRLPEHLARTPPWSAQPVLAELARFEWALTEVFDAADATAIGREALAGVEHAEWGALRFVFHPALRTVSLAWNAVAVWKALDAAPHAAAPSPRRRAAMRPGSCGGSSTRTVSAASAPRRRRRWPGRRMARALHRYARRSRA
ncbi:MAG: putative DNA-binding domain-containing protein [Steroidobacteraceae bacterium]